MSKLFGLLVGIALAAALIPASAQAQPAYTTTYVNLRAGPGYGYPIIVAVPPGAPLQSFGCLSDWSWCDVAWNGWRGWMSGEYIAYAYDNRWVALYDYGPRFGLPIIVFDFGLYWDTHYRSRPWYRDREHWRRYDHDHHDDHKPPPHRDLPSQKPPHIDKLPHAGNPPGGGGERRDGDRRDGDRRDSDKHDGDRRDGDRGRSGPDKR
jgi:uncharacterized protein YraI